MVRCGEVWCGMVRRGWVWCGERDEEDEEEKEKKEKEEANEKILIKKRKKNDYIYLKKLFF